MKETKPSFRARAPLRLGLAGGGTDVSSYCDKFGGAVLNVTISRYALATVSLLSEPVVQFDAEDLSHFEELPATERLPLDEGLKLHRAVYNFVVDRFLDGKPCPMRITTSVDSPMGSGLGSSSALVVAMLEALRKAVKLPLDKYDIAAMSYHIERVIAGLVGGRQDQYAATFGGINFMEFSSDDHVIVNPLRIPQKVRNELESSLLLCFTGVSRSSERIISEQIKSVSAKGSVELEAMHRLKDDAVKMKNALLSSNIREMADILGCSWDAKKRTSHSVSNPHLDEIYQTAIDHGAISGKISGAGGGGFMFFFVDPCRRNRVIRALAEKGAYPSNCHFVSEGAQSWCV